nr:zinc finger protein 638-like [Zootoca vivipara]
MRGFVPRMLRPFPADVRLPLLLSPFPLVPIREPPSAHAQPRRRGRGRSRRSAAPAAFAGASLFSPFPSAQAGPEAQRGARRSFVVFLENSAPFVNSLNLGIASPLLLGPPPPLQLAQIKTLLAFHQLNLVASTHSIASYALLNEAFLKIAMFIPRGNMPPRPRGPNVPDPMPCAPFLGPGTGPDGFQKEHLSPPRRMPQRVMEPEMRAIFPRPNVQVMQHGMDPRKEQQQKEEGCATHCDNPFPPVNSSQITSGKFTEQATRIQNRCTTESALSILASFGLSNEDLEELSRYPGDQLTSENLPLILRDIRMRKMTHHLPSLPSQSREKEMFHSDDGHSTMVKWKVIDYGHGSRYEYTETPSKVKNYNSDASTEGNVKGFPTQQTALVSLAPFGLTSSQMNAVNELIRKMGLQRSTPSTQSFPPMDASNKGPLLGLPPERDKMPPPIGVVKATWLPVVSQAVAQRLKRLPTPSMMNDYYAASPRIFPHTCSLCDVECTHLKILFLSTRSPASSAEAGSSRQPPAKSDVAEQPPNTSDAQKVKRLPTLSMINDYYAASPKIFPHVCSLCNVECRHLKDWNLHVGTTAHSEKRVQLRQQYPDWNPEDCSLLQRDEGDKKEKHIAMPCSTSSNLNASQHSVPGHASSQTRSQSRSPGPHRRKRSRSRSSERSRRKRSRSRSSERSRRKRSRSRSSERSRRIQSQYRSSQHCRRTQSQSRSSEGCRTQLRSRIPRCRSSERPSSSSQSSSIQRRELGRSTRSPASSAKAGSSRQPPVKPDVGEQPPNKSEHPLQTNPGHQKLPKKEGATLEQGDRQPPAKSGVGEQPPNKSEHPLQTNPDHQKLPKKEAATQEQGDQQREDLLHLVLTPLAEQSVMQALSVLQSGGAVGAGLAQGTSLPPLPPVQIDPASLSLVSMMQLVATQVVEAALASKETSSVQESPSVARSPQLSIPAESEEKKQEGSQEVVPGFVHSCSGLAAVRIWIVGHSIVHWASLRAMESGLGRHLGLPNYVSVSWMSRCGMRWDEFLPMVKAKVSCEGPPAAMVVQLGENDLALVHSFSLRLRMQNDLEELAAAHPGLKIFWSEFLQRRVWLGSRCPTAIERSRKRVDHAVGKKVVALGGSVIHHAGITLKDAGLYRPDGVNLSNAGNDVWLSNVSVELMGWLQMCWLQV